MPLQLTELPREIQTNIFTYNRHADLINVARACKALDSVVEPLIWTHIELHDQEWHESDPYRHGILSHIDNPSYRYIEPSPDYLQEYGGSEPTRFTRETFLRDRVYNLINAIPITRPRILHQMRSICMTIHFNGDDEKTMPDNLWTLFSRFPNLQALDLTVEWPWSGPEIWEVMDKAFRRSVDSLSLLAGLQDLRLNGYIPQAFARWLLFNSKHLRTLQLAILDRPIGGTRRDDRMNPPPGKQRGDSPDEEEETGDDDGIDPEVTDPSDPDTDSNADSDTSSTSSFNSEEIAPRALSILPRTDTDTDIDLLKPLQHLSTLILTRPAESSQPDDVWRDTYTSLRADTSILHEWTRLIRSSRSTLRHLILDQRPFCEEIELDGTGSTEFMELYPYGPGFERFQEIVLPVLLEEKDERGQDVTWPMLESITFYGFDVPEPMETKVHPRVQRRWMSTEVKNEKAFLGKVRRRFQGRNGGAENGAGVAVETYLGSRIVFQEESGAVTEDGLGPGWRPDPDIE